MPAWSLDARAWAARSGSRVRTWTASETAVPKRSTPMG